jgi:hypothetical protein
MASFELPGSTTTTSRSDRRLRPRRRVASAATVMVDAHLVDAVALDVSPGGVKIVTPGPLRVGTSVAVVLFVEGEIIDAIARICWSSPHGPNHFAMGLAFEQIEEETRLHLSRFCGAALS